MKKKWNSFESKNKKNELPELKSSKKISNYSPIINKGGFFDTEFEEFNKIKEISQGAYGRVFLVEVKTRNITRKIASKLVFDQKKQIYKEIRLLKKIPKHENLIEFISLISINFHIYINFEYFEGDDIWSYMKKSNNFFSKCELIEVIYQLLSGINCLHTQNPGIIHCDIHPGNILYSNRRLKICDYGSCITSNFKKKPEEANYFFIAPELVLNEQNYSFGSDIYACGLIINLLIIFHYTGIVSLPFQYPNEYPFEYFVVMANISKYKIPNFPNDTDEHLKLFCEGILKSRPNERPSAFECIQMIDKMKQ